MNCEYWKDIVQQLFDINKCRWASHVLATELICTNTLSESKLSENELKETNLGIALECVSQEEIIKGTIYAYKDWSAQPSCDLILAQFDVSKVESIFHNIESPTQEMKLGIEGFLEDLNEIP